VCNLEGSRTNPASGKIAARFDSALTAAYAKAGTDFIEAHSHYRPYVVPACAHAAK